MNTVRVEFKNDQGEQYVEMRVFKSVPWSLSKALAAVGDVEKDDSAKLAMAEKVAMALVVGGDVFDAWGDKMAFPLTSESVLNAPAEMIVAVLAKFGEMKSEADAQAGKS